MNASKTRLFWLTKPTQISKQVCTAGSYLYREDTIYWELIHVPYSAWLEQLDHSIMHTNNRLTVDMMQTFHLLYKVLSQQSKLIKCHVLSIVEAVAIRHHNPPLYAWKQFTVALLLPWHLLVVRDYDWKPKIDRIVILSNETKNVIVTSLVVCDFGINSREFPLFTVTRRWIVRTSTRKLYFHGSKLQFALSFVLNSSLFPPG